MSTGQILLAIFALVLLMNLSLSIHRAQIMSISDSMEYQIDLEANNFGHSIMEEIFYSLNRYDELDAFYVHLSDVSNPNSRLEYATYFGDTLYATVDLSNEKPLVHDVDGRQVTVRVYHKSDHNEYIMRVEYQSALNPIW